MGPENSPESVRSPEKAEADQSEMDSIVWTEVDRTRRRWILIVMWGFIAFNLGAVLYLFLR
jgi:hypothetical protein